MSDYLKPNARGGTVNLVYRGEDITTLVEYIEPGATLEDPHWHPESAHVFVVVEGDGEALVGNGVTADVQLATATVYSGSDILQQRGPISDKSAVTAQSKGAVYPDDFLLDDVAAAGERLSVELNLPALFATGEFVDTVVKITPL